jgi:hypothetical protein
MIETLSRAALVSASIPITTVATDKTTTGTGVAWAGNARSAMVVIWSGTVTDGTFTFEVQDSDNNSAFTAVADAYLEGAEPALTASDTVVLIGYKGTRKYLRVVCVSTGTTSGGIVGALVVSANPNRLPTR